MTDAGKVLITPKGKYSSSTTYEWYDQVIYNGKAYIALKSVKGVIPTDDGTNWKLYFDPGYLTAVDECDNTVATNSDIDAMFS